MHLLYRVSLTLSTNSDNLYIMKIKEDLTNKQFGQLIVLERDFSKIGLIRGSYWICRCICGTMKSIARHSLFKGTKSCGCLQKLAAMNGALPEAKADKNYWLRKYKARAKKLQIEFSLTDEEFYDICSMNCFYCDAQPVPRNHGYKRKGDSSTYYANGIDRIEPHVGYTKENSVPCCTPCNLMKTDKSQKEFIEMAIKIAIKHGRKNVI